MSSLVRPKQGRWIAGVCAGIANKMGWSPALVRLLFALSIILPGPQFIIYIVLWFVIPDEKVLGTPQP